MNLIKTPPHIYWLNSVLTTIEKMTLSNPKIRPLYEKVIDKGSVIGFVPKSEDEASLLMGMNLVFTVSGTQEIVVESDYSNNVRLQDLDEHSFKPPFEDMVFTVLKDGLYEDSFIQVFKLEEDYIDPNGKNSPVYCVKRMIHEKAYTIGLPSEYKASIEMIVIASKLPRVIFPSYITEQCRTCTISTETSMMERVGNVGPNQGVKYCMKTPNTMYRCRGDGITFAEAGFMILSTVIGFIKKLNKSPKRIERIARIANEVRSGMKVEKIIPEQRHYIEIKDNKYFYREPARERNSSGTHASPCMHLRRETTRTLKSGKVIPVKSSIVNPDGKKPVYIIKGGNKNDSTI